MNCPVCGGSMYDNRLNKKNPKGPDYRCKNKNCKYQLDPETGEYVESEYGTGVWLPKETKPAPTTPVHQPIESTDMKDKAIVMSYAKDIEVAKINGNIIPEGSPGEETVAIFKTLWAAIKTIK